MRKQYFVFGVLVYMVGVFLLIWSAQIGLGFPDIDLGILRQLPGIAHRSALTHGALIPVLLFLLARRYRHIVIRLGVIGFCTALAVHLSYDLFPNGFNGRWCWGYGCIHVPGIGQTSPLFSWLWIASGVLIALYISLRLVENSLDIGLFVGCVVVSYWHMLGIEPHIALKAFVALIVAGCIALILPSELRGTIVNTHKRLLARRD